MAETGQPYAYTGDDPVNGVDPMGLSWYNPSWAHKAVHRIARGAKKVGHLVAQHRRGLEQIGIGIAAVAAGIATAGLADGVLASIALGAGIGATASASSYTVGSLGIEGRNGFSFSGLAFATGAGALGGGVGGGVGSTELGTIAKSFIDVSSGGAIGVGTAEVNAAVEHQGLDLGASSYLGIGAESLTGLVGDSDATDGLGAWTRGGFQGGVQGLNAYLAFGLR